VAGRESLLAETEALNDLLVALLRLTLEVVEQLAALRDQLEKTAAGREVLRVGVQVVGEVLNALGQKGGLVAGAAGVLFVNLVFLQIDVAHDLSSRFTEPRT